MGPEPGPGVWWRFEFDDDVRARLRATVRDWNDLSIDLLELLSMVVTALTFVTQSDARPSLRTRHHCDAGGQHVRRSMVYKCSRGREPRSGALVRLLGCLEVGSGWCFDALYVAGVENTIANGISRWEPEDMDGNHHAFRPDVAWHRQVLRPTSRYALDCWRPAHPPVRCAVASPSLHVRFPVLGRFSGVYRGG